VPAPSPEIFLIFDNKMVRFCAFWWYYFTHVYTWGPITQSKWLVGLGSQYFFYPQWGDIHPCPPPLPTPLFSATEVYNAGSL